MVLAGHLLVAAAAQQPASPQQVLALPSFLSDHMVLQRGGARLWGFAPPGKTVVVQVESGRGTVFASDTSVAGKEAGAWELFLNVSARPTSTVTIKSGSQSKVLRDVAWGDVFLCSGQSNMEYPMADAFNGTSERESSNLANLRMLNLADRPWPVPTGGRNSSATDCPSKAPYVWAASEPSTISPRNSSIVRTTLQERQKDGPTDFSNKYPAAVCWFAARDLLSARPSIPIGIISAAKSGSSIECWMPKQAMLDGTPHVFGGNGTCGGAIVAAPRPVTTANSSCPRGGLSKSGAYYRGMIAPLTKMRLSAVWWCEFSLALCYTGLLLCGLSLVAKTHAAVVQCRSRRRE